MLTLLIRLLLIPLFRAQIVSQRRMQMLQPEIKAIQTKYKGNRTKISEETMKLYKERGVNPASGCLPAFLQLFLLTAHVPVFNTGPRRPGHQLDAPGVRPPGPPGSDLPRAGHPRAVHQPEHRRGSSTSTRTCRRSLYLPVIGFGVSLLAIIAAAAAAGPDADGAAAHERSRRQRSQQRIFLILPLFSLIYGAFLPAGLFIYWIVFTASSRSCSNT